MNPLMLILFFLVLFPNMSKANRKNSIVKKCAEDIKLLCLKETEINKCLQRNIGKLSPPCHESLDELKPGMARRRGLTMRGNR